jgi:uncharacterized membrane protein YeiB
MRAGNKGPVPEAEIKKEWVPALSLYALMADAETSILFYFMLFIYIYKSAVTSNCTALITAHGKIIFSFYFLIQHS